MEETREYFKIITERCVSCWNWWKETWLLGQTQNWPTVITAFWCSIPFNPFPLSIAGFYNRSDGTWLLRVCDKYYGYCITHLLSVSQITHSGGSQLPCHETASWKVYMLRNHSLTKSTQVSLDGTAAPAISLTESQEGLKPEAPN